MLYAERDSQGNIITIRKDPPDGQQQTPVSDQELQEFLAREADQETYEILLQEADKKMIRVLDDLIEVLIRKNIILLTDLPEEAREKLGTRKEARRKMQENGVEITVDDIL